MGAATVKRLEAAGHRVIGVDLHSAEVVVNLASPEGRVALVEGVTSAANGVIDAVIACAGVAWTGASDATKERITYDSPEIALRVNYFGAIASLNGLRPLLARGRSPRAAAIASTGVILGGPDSVVEYCLSGEEERAVEAIRSYSSRDAYYASKRALARWVRRQAPTPEWAGAGIPLNAVGPGRIETPMGAMMRDDPASAGSFPMPLHGPGKPEDVASLLDWLTSEDNVLTTGQLIFIDGGWDAVTRGDSIW
jgi:NAD(P)-dependent dehydrogenase (short-subunit alcohol dehydrogenase family)